VIWASAVPNGLARTTVRAVTLHDERVRIATDHGIVVMRAWETASLVARGT
jgi:hypothetical protein